MKKKDTAESGEARASQFTLKDFLDSCLTHWKWFVVSVVCFVLLGYVYVMRKQPIYERSMSVLVKDQDGGGGMGEIANQFSSLGLVSTNTNVYNELIALLSPEVMRQVVEQLHLQVDVMRHEYPHSVTLYGTTNPYIVDFPDLGTQASATFRMDVRPDGSVRLYKFTRNAGAGIEKFDKEYELKPGFVTVRTPVGRVVFTPNPRFDSSTLGNATSEGYTLKFIRRGQQATIEMYSSRLKGDLADKDAEVINLSVKDVSTERATDILNTVLKVYTDTWVQDKNRMAVATSQFINERLVLIAQELGDVDSNIADFQSKTLVPDIEEAAKLTMKNTREMDTEILDIHNQLSMANYMKDYINNPSNAHNVIPINTGVFSMNVEQQISTYNSMLLARNNLAAGSSAANPLVAQYDSQLAGMRDAISRALNSQVALLTSTLNNMHGAKASLTGELAAAPGQAKQLRGVQREQEVKEQLYLFLLQKREENELSQTFTADNTRVITPPQGSTRPVAPNGPMILLVMFFAGLAMPALVIYMRESSNSKVRARKDLEGMEAPFIGEIPLLGKKENKFIAAVKKRRNAKKRVLEAPKVFITPGSRDVASESFKIIRGNIDFMTQRGKGGSIIMLTSFNPGSGKSFITYNLAASFAVKGKKVLVIDCDLRHGSSSQFVGMPSKGISNYLTGNTDDWQSLVKADPNLDGLYVLPIGHRPPNPSELLDNGRFAKIAEDAAESYDYVFLDCPPIDVVVDTQILEKYADRTIFVVRAGLFKKEAVAEIDEIYRQGRVRNMSVLLNGTDSGNSRFKVYGSSYYGSDFKD